MTTPTLAIIGCGGSGGWAVQMLSKSPKQELRIVLADGDSWDAGNLDRCLASRADLRRPKTFTAARLLEKAGWAAVESWPRYLSHGTPDWDGLLAVAGQLRLLVCPDNHACRSACLRLADSRARAGLETVVVLTGNELKTAGADVYLPPWRGAALDPRVRYPEIETDTAGNPLHPSCTGEAAESAPQLALSNGLSALAGLKLMSIWAEELPARRGGEYYEEIEDKAPVSIRYGAIGAKVLSKKEIENESNR